jgi:uncharacterized protein (DUF433 family)
MSTVPMEHVWLDDRGVAWIDDTNVKVIEVAIDQIAHGLSAEEIFAEHGRHLSLAQIHAALACYYDHQPEFDREIGDQLRDYEKLRADSLASPMRQKLRSLGKLP